MKAPPADPGHHDPATISSTLGWLAVMLALSLPLYRQWAGLAAHAILLLWFFDPGVRGRIRSLRRDRLSLAVLAFVALNLLSLLWSSDPAAGFSYVSKYRYLLLVPMIATSVAPARRLLATSAFIAAAAVSVALSAAVALGLLRIGDAHAGNPSPTMAHIDYTVLLAVAALLALVRVLYGNGGRGRRLGWLAAFLLLAGGLAVNIGRSGQLGFVAGLAVLLLHWSRGRTAAAAAAAAGLAAATLALLALSPPVINRIGEGVTDFRAAVVDQEYESNVGGRLAALTVAAAMVREDPLLGTGAGGNMPAFRHLLDTEFQELKPAVFWYRHLHNQYAQIATELGLAGLAALAWIFWELVRGPYHSRGVQASALVIAAVYLASFVGDPFLHKQLPLLTFALFAGLTAGARFDERATPAPAPGSDPAPAAA